MRLELSKVLCKRIALLFVIFDFHQFSVQVRFHLDGLAMHEPIFNQRFHKLIFVIPLETFEQQVLSDLLISGPVLIEGSYDGADVAHLNGLNVEWSQKLEIVRELWNTKD